MYDFRWRPYVSVAARRQQAARKLAKLGKQGHRMSPVVIEGRAIARTFWGKAWCTNLERYSDFSNRLPRGRSYVRNGLVLDLQIAPGEVKALVSGSAIYRVAVKVAAVPKPHWVSICKDCAGAIDSLVELLQGRFSKNVMERICQEKKGLFPAPAEIQLSCSCPDWASMCKHVAAVLYGTGARLDSQPELLFKLRQVDEKDLIAKAGHGLPLSKKGPAADKILSSDDLAAVFGLEMATPGEKLPPKAGRARGRVGRGRRPSTPVTKPKGAAPAVNPAREPKPRGKSPSSPPVQKKPKSRAATKAKKRTTAKGKRRQ